MKRKLARSFKLVQALDLGVLIRVGEKALLEQVDAGLNLRRLIVDRVADGYRLILLVKDGTEPLTVARKRGGLRTWAQLESLIRWIEKNLPSMPEALAIELYLRPALDSD